jgi:hypothetical protein
MFGSVYVGFYICLLKNCLHLCGEVKFWSDVIKVVEEVLYIFFPSLYIISRSSTYRKYPMILKFSRMS